MGLFASKVNKHSASLNQHTPEIDNADPRSPTPEITRTPLQGKNSLKQGITKNADLRKNFEAKGDNTLIQNNPILTAVIKKHLQSYDPRSPTQDFERTPIIISSKENRHKNGNDTETPQVPSDSACDLSNIYTVCTPTIDALKSRESISPIDLINDSFDISINETCNDEEPLGSSTASKDSIDLYFTPEHNMKSSKMLETDFDIMESAQSLEEGDCNNIQESVKAFEYFKILDNDPRSPSVGIERTPIVVTQFEDSPPIMSVEEMSDDSLINVLTNTNVKLRNAASKTKNADLRKNFEAKGDNTLIQNNPILTAVIKNHLQSYDPRSPTQDFERTPIIISSKENRHKNGNDTETPQVPSDSACDLSNIYTVCTPTMNGLKSLESISPIDLINDSFDISINETCNDEEPLGSSTASKDLIDPYFTTENNMKYSKMLETDFDIMESAQSLEEGDCNNIQESVKAFEYFKIVDNDPRSPSVGIERTPIVVTQIEDSPRIMSVEEMSDNSLINVLTNTNVKLRNAASKSNRGKSDGLLIYEDETNSVNVTPHKPKSEGLGKYHRTPLACMENKTDAAAVELDRLHGSKSTTNLNESKTFFSKIPRLKSLVEKNNTKRVSLKNIHKSVLANKIDCENNPSHSHRDKWDMDSSVVL